MHLEQRALALGLQRKTGETDAQLKARVEAAEQAQAHGMGSEPFALEVNGTRADLYIYGNIGESLFAEGVGAQDIARQLDEIEAENVVVHMNSFGGSVPDGLAIYNALRAKDATVLVSIEGVAVSIASLIAMAGDTVEMAENALFMVHAPWGLSVGNARDMRAYADLLDKFANAMATSYARKTGQDRDIINGLLTDGEDHWYDASEAQDFGFVDQITTDEDAEDAALAAGFNQSVYAREAVNHMIANHGQHGWQRMAAAGTPKTDPRLAGTHRNDINDLTPDAVQRLHTQLDSLLGAGRPTPQPAAPGAAKPQRRSNAMNLEARAKAVGLQRLEGETDEQLKARVEAAEAQTRGDGGGSPNNDPNAPAAAGNHTDPEAAAQQALADERQRREKIRATFRPHLVAEGVQEVMDACLDEPSITPEQANEKLLAKLGEGAEPLAAQPVDVRVTDSQPQKFARGASLALAAKAGLEQDDEANEFRAMTLLDMARASLQMHGVDVSRMDKMALVSAAFQHTTGDFGNLLKNVANKAMLKGYDEAEETFQRWTNTGTLPDFKESWRVDLNSFPSLREVRPGAEYKYASVGDRGENIALATFGELFSINRQAIINDDLQLFTRIPMKMGRAAIRTVGDLVYAILVDNPKMSDGTALFHSNHKNLVSSGGAPSTAQLDTMRTLMAKQKDGGENATALNIRMAYALGPVALDGALSKVARSEKEVTTSGDSTAFNTMQNRFEVISDARLDDDSESKYYGVANPAMHDTIEVAYLDGQSRPVLEQQDGWKVDGAEFKVRLDAGVSPLDFRTMVRNPGA